MTTGGWLAPELPLLALAGAALLPLFPEAGLAPVGSLVDGSLVDGSLVVGSLAVGIVVGTLVQATS